MRARLLIPVVFLVACQSSTAAPAQPQARTPTVYQSSGVCPVASLTVTGTAGEGLNPQLIPPGLTLEGPTGATELTYIGPGAGGGSWLEIEVYRTNLPPESLIAGRPLKPITVQGLTGKLLVTGPAATPDVKVTWTEQPGIDLMVLGHQVPAPDVIGVAQHLKYSPGTIFTYPNRVSAGVSRRQALRMLPEASAAFLTSAGEAEAVLHAATSVAVTRPVWVVSSSQRALVVDAVSGNRLTSIDNPTAGAVESLTDRSTARCEPPFGVLTRTESMSIRPPLVDTNSMVKLMTLGMLKAIPQAMLIGDCDVYTCDPNELMWVQVSTAGDCRLLLRCSGPPPYVAPPAPPGTWRVAPLDARTGQPQAAVTFGIGGHGPLPADVAALPDLATGS